MTGFTLIELLVAILIFVILIGLLLQVFSSVTTLATMVKKHGDSDAEVRGLLDRMAVDFAAMIKRVDVDIFLKSPLQPQTGSSGSGANDQIAFFSEVPGYAVANGTSSNVSLVAYRINTTTTSIPYAERMGKGLLWSTVGASNTGMIFLPQTILSVWATATNSTADPSYDIAAYGVFRFEYYYVLQSQTVGGVNYPSVLSATPWDTRIAGHASINGLSDVAAIGVVVAALDTKSGALVSQAQLSVLAAAMPDFNVTNYAVPGSLVSAWNSASQASTLPLPVKQNIRIYAREFTLNIATP